MDAAATKEPESRPAPDGPTEAQEPAPPADGPTPAAPPADGPSPAAPASVDDVPQQHGITEDVAQQFLSSFLPVGAEGVLQSYRYRPIASLGEGYTTVRKVLELTYRDQKTGQEDVAVLVVKVPSECAEMAASVPNGERLTLP